MMDETSSSLRVEKCKEQLKIAVDKGDKNEESCALDNLGEVYASLGLRNEAIECFKSIASNAIESGLSIPQGRAYYKIGHRYNELGDYGESIMYFQKCVNALQGKGDERIERMAYCDLGGTYLSLGNVTEAIKYLQISHDMALDANDSFVACRACQNLGNCYNILERHDEAISFFKKSLQLSTETEQVSMSLMSSNSLGDTFQALRRHEEAITNHKKSLEYAIKSADKIAEQKAYLDLGVDFEALGDFQKAVEYFGMYINNAKLLNDRKAEVSGYSYLGNAYFLQGMNEQAIACHQNSLDTALKVGSTYGQECAHLNMAAAFTVLGKYEEALHCHEKKLKFALEKEDKREEERIYKEMGKAHISLRNYEEAIRYRKKNLALVTERAGDRKEEGLAYVSIGDTYYLLADYKEAVQYYGKYLNIAIETQNSESEQEAYNKLGVLYGKLNRYEESIKYIKKELEMVSGKGHDKKSTEAKIYCNLGVAYVALGRYEEAIDGYEKSLGVALQTNDKELQEFVHCNIGNVYYILGNRLEAANHYEKSAKIAMSIGSKEAEARGYCVLGRISGNSGNYEKAIEYAKKHLDVAQILGNKQREVFAYHDLGRNSYLIKKYEDAIKYLEMSASLANEIGDRKAEGSAFECLGYVYQDKNNYTKAIEHYEKALNLAKEIGNKAEAGKALRNLGGSFLFLYLYGKNCNEKCKSEHKDKAEEFLKESLQWFDSMFDDLGDKQDEHKINVIDTFIDTHKLLVELYIETGHPERALLVSEQERGRALEDLLIGKYKLEDKAASTYDIDEWIKLTNKIVYEDSCILFFSSLAKPNRPNHSPKVGSWVFDLEKRISFQSHDLKELSNALNERFPEIEITKSKDILHSIVDKTYTSMSVRGSCENRSFIIDDDAASVTDAASFSQDSEFSKRCVEDEEPDEDVLEVLYEALITPIQSKLTEDEIVIIPEGPLFKVPFAALRDPMTKLFLAEIKRIRIVPSLNTLNILQETSAESHSMTGALIVGDPDVNGKRKFKGKERFFNPLPNARIEAEKIGEVLGVTALTGSQATKQVIMNRLREGVAVIHFAAHGCADSGEIVLSPPLDVQKSDNIPEENDYLLTVGEVQATGLRARLVVLSCCHSGRGEIKSEGVIGMSRAFLAAGALAVVASLWAVDDRGTRVFMEKFYSHLKQGKSASICLQQAMSEMRAMSIYEKPVFWAPFVLIGDDVTIKL